MKKVLFTGCAVLALAMTGQAAEFKGWISDASCGAGNGSSSTAARECAERCIKGGAAPVFVTEKEQTVYKLTNAEMAKQHLKGKVQVTGELKGDTLHIAKIVDIKD
ncbi:MAG: hypothetical protein JNM66_29190 [Bryobacterales bacterium]|nr:hypothetical protein [Bryobacterales bacterium]